MPITLEQLRQETKELSIPVGDDAITFQYRVNAFTPEMEETLRDLDDEEVKSRTVREMIKRLVASWDIKENTKDKQCLPVSDEVIAQLPTRILVRMITAVGDDLSPDPTSAVSSNDS
jgi:hypothetical protein